MSNQLCYVFQFWKCSAIDDREQEDTLFYEVLAPDLPGAMSELAKVCGDEVAESVFNGVKSEEWYFRVCVPPISDALFWTRRPNQENDSSEKELSQSDLQR